MSDYINDYNVHKAEVLDLIKECNNKVEIMKDKNGKNNRVIRAAAVVELFNTVWDLES